MADKMMRVAGRDYDTGSAKAIRTKRDGTQFVQQMENIEEITLVEGKTLNKGEFNHHSFDVHSGFRILVKIKKGFSAKWSVKEYPRILNWIRSSAEKILESDGEDVLLGNGVRSLAYTDVLTPLSTSNRIEIEHMSDSDEIVMEYDVVLQRHLNTSVGGVVIDGEKHMLLEPFDVNRNGTIEGGMMETILETKGNTIIDSLEVSSDHDEMQIILQYMINGDYKSLATIKKDGSSRLGVYAKSIVQENASMWNILSYEEGAYKYSLKKPLVLPEGCRVRIRNNSSDEKNSAVSIYGRVEK